MTTPAVSAALSVQEGIAAAIENDVALGDKLAGDKVYGAVAPEKAKTPYVVIANPSEAPSNTFGRRGNADTFFLHVWSKRIGNREVLTIYADLIRLLHGTRIALTGHSAVLGELTLVTVLPDPDQLHMHLVAQYRVVSRVG